MSCGIFWTQIVLTLEEVFTHVCWHFVESLLWINHRIIRVGKDLQDHLIQPSCYHQCHSLNHAPKHYIQLFLKHPLGRWLHQIPGQPIAMSNYSFWEEMSPHFQPKAPWDNLRPFPLVLEGHRFQVIISPKDSCIFCWEWSLISNYDHL